MGNKIKIILLISLSIIMGRGYEPTPIEINTGNFYLPLPPELNYERNVSSEKRRYKYIYRYQVFTDCFYDDDDNNVCRILMMDSETGIVYVWDRDFDDWDKLNHRSPGRNW